ncbi:MAG: DUF2330 domain-containing protein [Candidatus Competibacterales bacterium]
MMRWQGMWLGLLVLGGFEAQAFCGFYVSRAGAELFNQASKVVMARHGDRTVMTMVNDYQGEVEDFAIVIPVPVVLQESQVNIAEGRLVDHLDAYTAPRLVEYYDADPCARMEYRALESAAPVADSAVSAAQSHAEALGVTVEAEYTVGEYDIVILSAQQSDGLLTYLNQEGFVLPAKAEGILGSYIKQDLKFFLARVNLENFDASGFTNLRPLQMAFESNKFTLPIRLGTVNARGPQDLILFTLTRRGRVEPLNYRTVKIPSNLDVPLFVKNEFGEFYRAMFDTAVAKENLRAVFLEYAWNMAWCDPCAADPPTTSDLRTLGVWWLAAPQEGGGPTTRPTIMPTPAPAEVFVTRLHLRYTAETFPEDLILQETGDSQNFQGRYVLRHPYRGPATCPAGEEYFSKLPARFEKEAQSLARLTGWEMERIRQAMEGAGQGFAGYEPTAPKPWWEQLWSR